MTEHALLAYLENARPNDNASDESFTGNPKNTEYNVAYNSAHNTDCNISQHRKVAVHKLSGKPAGNAADDNTDYNSHDIPSFLRQRLNYC